MLRQAGVRSRRPRATDVELTWQVMRRFAGEPVPDAAPREQDGDGVLAQYGTYDWGNGEHFELDMTRQFSFTDEDGEYSHMAQLHCAFWYKPTRELRALGEDNLWSFGMELDDFFAQALAMPGFRGVREAGVRPRRLVIDYGDV
jgi:hypothetical protein